MATELDRPSETRAATAEEAGTRDESVERPAPVDRVGAVGAGTGTAATAADAPAPSPEVPSAPAPAPAAATERTTAEPTQLIPRRTRMVPIGTFEIPAAIRPIAPPDGWADVLTGADGPRLWDRIVLSEQARVARYHRPVTVAFAELVGLEGLAGQWGWDVAERALAACARRLGREIRSSDQIARLEQARFGILLTETTEIAAINFVERARSSCERELKATGDAVRIGFGWASPPDKGDLTDAIGIALTRLAAELETGPTV
jgi:diguanylate cyclase (GGDEF)-like protein